MSERIPQLWPLIIYSVMVFGTVMLILGISYFLGERHHGRYSDLPFESGNLPTGTGRLRVFIRFYIIAVLFVVFDIETVFIFAWAVSLRDSGWEGLVEMVIFIGVLIIALIYLKCQGALEIGPSKKSLLPKK